MPKPPKRKNESDSLQGWQQIAGFLGQSLSVVQRWAKSGMPVTREGRHVHASPGELNRWLGRESAGEPVQIITANRWLTCAIKAPATHAVLRGILAGVVAWTLVVSAYLGRLNVVAKRQGSAGLMAMAGGWTYLFHRPSVMILLTAAFGVGLYLTAHWISH